MPSKRELPEGVYGTVPQDPRDTARAILLEPQFPVVKALIPRTHNAHSGAVTIRRRQGFRRNLPGDGRRGTTPLKVTDEVPKSR